MARPQSEGLDYFPLDVDMDSDDKIEYIEAKYGLVAFGIIVKLMMAIYRQGYYMMWTERQQYVFSKRVNVDINTVSAVVNVCINEGLFHKTLYEKYKILTSHGIQTRYLRAVERRRGVRMITEFCLITEADGIKEGRIAYQNMHKTVIADNNDRSEGVNVDNNQGPSEIHVSNMSTETSQSKVKESKLDDDDNARANPDQDFAEVATLFSDNIHPITGEIEAGKLADFLEHYGKVWVLEAIKTAVDYHGTTVAYIGNILANWERRGFKAEKEKGAVTHGRSRDGGNTGGSGLGKNECSADQQGYYDDWQKYQEQHRPWDVSAAPGGTGAPQGGDQPD